MRLIMFILCLLCVEISWAGTPIPYVTNAQFGNYTNTRTPESVGLGSVTNDAQVKLSTLQALGTGILKNTTTTGALSIITPTTCTGQAATGIDASGNATGCYTPAGTYTLPTATSSVLGGVKPDGTSILNTSGAISATAASVGAAATNQTMYIGTTSHAINRGSGAEALTGITSIDGTAANLSGTPALPDGTTATTQAAGDNSTKLATTAFINTMQAWQAPTLLNSWANYGSGQSDAGYFKDPFGIVHLKGLIKDGSTAVIFTLPAGYRIQATGRWLCISGAGYAYVSVSSGGDVTLEAYVGGSNAGVDLSTISFATH